MLTQTGAAPQEAQDTRDPGLHDDPTHSHMGGYRFSPGHFLHGARSSVLCPWTGSLNPQHPGRVGGTSWPQRTSRPSWGPPPSCRGAHCPRPSAVSMWSPVLHTSVSTGALDMWGAGNEAGREHPCQGAWQALSPASSGHPCPKPLSLGSHPCHLLPHQSPLSHSLTGVPSAAGVSCLDPEPREERCTMSPPRTGAGTEGTAWAWPAPSSVPR